MTMYPKHDELVQLLRYAGFSFDYSDRQCVMVHNTCTRIPHCRVHPRTLVYRNDMWRQMRPHEIVGAIARLECR